MHRVFDEIPGIIEKIIDTFLNTDWLQVGIDILKGLAQGLIEGVKHAIEAVKKVAKMILDKFFGLFKIHSPSRVFRDKVGVNLAKGIGVGFVDEMEHVSRQMAAAIPTRFGGIVLAGGISPSTLAAASAGVPGGVVLNQTVNNYSPKALSPAETARLNRNAMRQMVMGVKFA